MFANRLSYGSRSHSTSFDLLADRCILRSLSTCDQITVSRVMETGPDRRQLFPVTPPTGPHIGASTGLRFGSYLLHFKLVLLRIGTCLDS